MAANKKRRLADRARAPKQYRWGATKAQGERNARERRVKNQIADLETSLSGAQVVIGNLVTDRDRYRRMVDSVASPRALSALRQVCKISTFDAMLLGIDEPLRQLCKWLTELEGGVIDNIKTALATDNPTPQAKSGPADGVFPPVSGVTKVLTDHDDPSSVDDMFAKSVDVHLERMDHDYYWLGITPVGGQTVHVDITIDKKRKRTLRARVRK